MAVIGGFLRVFKNNLIIDRSRFVAIETTDAMVQNRTIFAGAVTKGLSTYLPSDHLLFLMMLTGGLFRLLKQSISRTELKEACTY